MGYALMGTAIASGHDRAEEAARQAISSPLLEDTSIDGARGILINITGSSNLRLHEVHEASTIIQEAAHEDANIIFGAVLDEEMGDAMKITVIATGFRGKGARDPQPVEPIIVPRPDPAPVRQPEPVPEPVAAAPAVVAVAAVAASVWDDIPPSAPAPAPPPPVPAEETLADIAHN